MDKKTIKKINQTVYRQFPELNGKNPSVRFRKTTSGKTNEGSGNYTLTYKKTAKVQGSKNLNILIRVVCTETGRILKISSSK